MGKFFYTRLEAKKNCKEGFKVKKANNRYYILKLKPKAEETKKED